MADITKLSIDDTRFLAELEKTGVLLRAGLLLNLSPSSSSRNFSRIRSYFPQEIFRQMEGIWVPDKLLPADQAADSSDFGSF